MWRHSDYQIDISWSENYQRSARCCSCGMVLPLGIKHLITTNRLYKNISHYCEKCAVKVLKDYKTEAIELFSYLDKVVKILKRRAKWRAKKIKVACVECKNRLRAITRGGCSPYQRGGQGGGGMRCPLRVEHEGNMKKYGVKAS